MWHLFLFNIKQSPLLLNGVKTECHWLNDIVENSVLLSSLTLHASIYRSNLVGILDRILIIHTIMVESYGLGSLLTL